MIQVSLICSQSFLSTYMGGSVENTCLLEKYETYFSSTNFCEIFILVLLITNVAYRNANNII